MSSSTATVTWTPTGGTLRRCTFTGSCTVGRALSNRIILDGDGVSREQAVLELTNSQLRVVNRSRSCAMTLNELHAVPPGGQASLRQGDRLRVGAHALTVASLSVAHQVLRCSNETCGREVAAHLSDCPWCGRSLAFAQTILPGR